VAAGAPPARNAGGGRPGDGITRLGDVRDRVVGSCPNGSGGVPYVVKPCKDTMRPSP